MRLRELIRLLRMRVNWCELIRWIALRVATRQSLRAANERDRDRWLDIATLLRAEQARWILDGRPHDCPCGHALEDFREAVRERRFKWE